MELAPTQYTSIEGTLVRVSVDSDTEAKLALKELRQKKKEYALIKKRLLQQQKPAKAAVRADEAERERLKRKRGMIAAVQRFADMFDDADEQERLALINRELADTNQILHSIEECIVQIEGKLLHKK